MEPIPLISVPIMAKMWINWQFLSYLWVQLTFHFDILQICFSTYFYPFLLTFLERALGAPLSFLDLLFSGKNRTGTENREPKFCQEPKGTGTED